ncbi:MAG: hypothetical protein H7Z39_04240 [Burkholderiaceae bacterium]|nr:hypothetical protein [Burkholderiaceae bacterium]
MSLGNSVTTRQHLAIQNESRAGYYTPMRRCTGECKTRRSIGQFTAGSTVCIRCARRTKQSNI